MCAVALVLGALNGLVSPGALEDAIQRSDTERVKALIRCDARVNPPRVTQIAAHLVLGSRRPRTPLEIAILYSDLKTIEVLLGAGARTYDRTSTGRLPMELAFVRGRRDVGALLVRYGAATLDEQDLPAPGFRSFQNSMDYNPLDTDLNAVPPIRPSRRQNAPW